MTGSEDDWVGVREGPLLWQAMCLQESPPREQLLIIPIRLLDPLCVSRTKEEVAQEENVPE